MPRLYLRSNHPDLSRPCMRLVPHCWRSYFGLHRSCLAMEALSVCRHNSAQPVRMRRSSSVACAH